MSTCSCNEYPFPHRHGGGKCLGLKYVCDDCFSAFEEFDVVCVSPATWGYSGGEPAEYVNLCPHCGSEEFEEVTP